MLYILFAAMLLVCNTLVHFVTTSVHLVGFSWFSLFPWWLNLAIAAGILSWFMGDR